MGSISDIHLLRLARRTHHRCRIAIRIDTPGVARPPVATRVFLFPWRPHDRKCHWAYIDIRLAGRVRAWRLFLPRIDTGCHRTFGYGEAISKFSAEQ